MPFPKFVALWIACGRNLVMSSLGLNNKMLVNTASFINLVSLNFISSWLLIVLQSSDIWNKQSLFHDILIYKCLDFFYMKFVRDKTFTFAFFYQFEMIILDLFVFKGSTWIYFLFVRHHYSLPPGLFLATWYRSLISLYHITEVVDMIIHYRSGGHDSWYWYKYCSLISLL